MRAAYCLKQRLPKKTSRKKRKETRHLDNLWFEDTGKYMMNELKSALPSDAEIRRTGTGFYVKMPKKAFTKDKLTELLDEELLPEFEIITFWTDGKTVIFTIKIL